MKLIALLTLLITCSLQSATAGEGAIKCHTSSLSKVFRLENGKVTFLEERKVQGRKVASLFVSRTKRNGDAVTQIVSFEGHKHTIHIENQSEFSELNDYLVIKSNKGHEVTYSLSCSKA